MARKLASWLEGFLAYSEGRESPQIFRTWAGLSSISAALQRRVWTNIKEQNQYANLYVLLVAEPGIGKGNALRAALEIVTQNASIKLAPDCTTRRQIYRDIGDSAVHTHNLRTGERFSHHSMSAFMHEFGLFVRRGELDFMVDLANLFDCPKKFEYRTVHVGGESIEYAWFSFLGCCTPYWVKETFTDEAIDQGFPARIIMVYSDEKVDVPLFGRSEDKNELEAALVHDLGEITTITGEYRWKERAAKEFANWVKSGMEPVPSNPKLQHYSTRRVTHISKLCMLMAAAKRNELVIELEDVFDAMKILFTAEATMIGALKAVGQNKYAGAQERVVTLIKNVYNRSKKPVPEYVIWQSLEKEVPPYLIPPILESLLTSKRLGSLGKSPDRTFVPLEMSSDYVKF